MALKGILQPTTVQAMGIISWNKIARLLCSCTSPGDARTADGEMLDPLPSCQKRGAQEQLGPRRGAGFRASAYWGRERSCIFSI